MDLTVLEPQEQTLTVSTVAKVLYLVLALDMDTPSPQNNRDHSQKTPNSYQTTQIEREKSNMITFYRGTTTGHKFSSLSTKLVSRRDGLRVFLVDRAVGVLVQGVR